MLLCSPKGVTLESKEQTQLINMRGQGWPYIVKYVGRKVEQRECVRTYQRVCVISAEKKSGAAGLVLLE